MTVQSLRDVDVALMIVRRIGEGLASRAKGQPSYHSPSATDDLTARLEILRLILGAQLNGTSGTVSSTSSEARRLSAARLNGDPGQPSNVKQDTNKQRPNEAAVRVLGMTLIAAVLLAGSFFFGGQTLPLRENIERTVSTAENVLETIGRVEREPVSESSSRRSKNEEDLNEAEWKQIQEKLTARGFSPGPIDGNPGQSKSKTRQAIRKFQTENGDPANGHLTPNQIKALACAS